MAPSDSDLILVVDDTASSRAVLTRGLGSVGYSTCAAASGLEAIELVRERRPALLLLDVMMPGLSGLEVLAHLRESHVSSDLPVIMVTAREDASDVVAALTAGANDYIIKPVDLSVCCARINTQLELRRAAADLRAAKHVVTERNAELERLDREKNHLLGMAAHDLRNPLSVIKFYSEFLLMDTEAPREDRVQFLKTICTTSDAMLKLLDDLLSLSRIESGQLQLNRQPTDVRALIEEKVALNRVLATNKSMVIDLDVSPLLPELSIDGPKIGQVLDNLITNAVKYSPPPNAIHVAAGLDAVEIAISVTDHGPGIPEDERAQLFEPFKRTSVRSTGGESSTGLGLAIARRIVEGHGGRIGLDSTVGRGSRFWFSLPLG